MLWSSAISRGFDLHPAASAGKAQTHSVPRAVCLTHAAARGFEVGHAGSRGEQGDGVGQGHTEATDPGRPKKGGALPPLGENQSSPCSANDIDAAPAMMM